MADNGEGVLLQRPNGSSSSSSGENLAAYSGWVYHLGTNSIGHEFCHLRYLLVRGKNILMYKRDPRKEPGHKPIRKGVAGPCLMVEELGRKRVGRMDLYVLKFYNRLNEMKKGEIACTAAGDVRKWMEVFEQAKQQAEFDLLSGSSSRKLSIDDEINLEGHRPRVRRYAKELIKIGKGPEALLQSSNLGNYPHQSNYMDGEVDNAIEAHEWKCIHTTNGMRIFEDISSSKSGKNILLKSVGIVDANLDLVFEMVYNLDKSRRYEWDTVSDHLEVVDTIDGHFDVVYGTYNQNYQDGIDCCGRPKIYDFVFSRQWFRGQDGAYTILQIPTVHKKCPNKPGYHRAKVNRMCTNNPQKLHGFHCKHSQRAFSLEFKRFSTNLIYAKDSFRSSVLASIWEIKMLKTSSVEANNTKCLVTLMIEVHLGSWLFGNRYFSKLERTVEYAQLCQVAGLREYLGANPALILDSASLIHQKKVPEDIDISGELITEVSDQFYDAIAADESLEEEDSDDEEIDITKGGKVKLKNVSWAIAAFSLKKPAAVNASNELDLIQTPVRLETNQLLGSLRQGKNESDSNCWMNAPGNGFMIRGKTYLSDYSKVPGSDPLLKLFAVDWLKAENNINEIASHPNCLVQSEAIKKLPFVLVINLQVPAKPNYSLALYYGSERPIRKGSLLSKFVDGTDAFRSSRFKLIPSVVEGYWMVKRAVGTKACLLGRAVTCRYIRGDNFLEIDVDIGSSSVARSIIGLVLGYVSSIVVDLAILIEAKEEEELPEYVLGTVRLNKIKVDSAVPFVAS